MLHLSAEVLSCLEKVIHDELLAFNEIPVNDREVGAHTEFAENRARQMFGRDPVLAQIESYGKGRDARPLLIHGALVLASQQCSLRPIAIWPAQIEPRLPFAGSLGRLLSPPMASRSSTVLLARSLKHTASRYRYPMKSVLWLPHFGNA